MHASLGLDSSSPSWIGIRHEGIVRSLPVSLLEWNSVQFLRNTYNNYVFVFKYMEFLLVSSHRKVGKIRFIILIMFKNSKILRY